MKQSSQICIRYEFCLVFITAQHWRVKNFRHGRHPVLSEQIVNLRGFIRQPNTSVLSGKITIKWGLFRTHHTSAAATATRAADGDIVLHEAQHLETKGSLWTAS